MLSKADTHVHTYYSGTTHYKALRFPESVTSPEEQVDAARRNGMSVVCITDHDSTMGGFKALEYGRRFDDIDVVVGEEIMTSDGEVIGLWLNEQIEPGMTAEETIDEIRSQGGIVIAPHPFSFYVNCLKHRIFNLDIDGIEVINGGHVDPWTNNYAMGCYKSNAKRWAQIGASDAHSTRTAGFTWTEFSGQGEDDLRKAILEKTTVACGHPSPVFTQTQWSIEVVQGGQKMIWDSIFGRLKDDPENPLVVKTKNLARSSKALALVGGFVYCCPPVPFIATWLSTNWLKKKATDLRRLLRRTYDY